MASYFSQIKDVDAVLNVAKNPAEVVRAIIRGHAWSDMQKLYAWANLSEADALAMLKEVQ